MTEYTGDKSVQDTADPNSVVDDSTVNLTDKEKAFYAKAQDEKSKRQAMEEENRLLRQQAQIATANQPVQQPQESAIDRAAKALGYDDVEDDDVFTRGQLKNINAYIQKENQEKAMVQQATQSFNSAISAEEYDKVVGVGQGQTFRSSKYLQEAIKRDPALASQIQGPTGALTAYRAAKIIEQEEMIKAKQFDEHQTILEDNIQKKTQPGSASSVGGGGQLNRAGHINSMSDEEFIAFDAEVSQGAHG